MAAADIVSVTETVCAVTPVPEIVIKALYVFAVKLAVLMDTVMESVSVVVVPETGESVNQAALSLPDHVKVPPPVLLMLRVRVAGLAPPAVAAKERLVGLVPMAGGTGAAATVKETGTVTGVTPVPPLSVTVPLLGPTDKLPVVAVSVTLPLPVPPVVESVNHGALSLTVQFKVPPPVLLMLRVCVAGLAPP